MKVVVCHKEDGEGYLEQEFQHTESNKDVTWGPEGITVGQNEEEGTRLRKHKDW